MAIQPSSKTRYFCRSGLVLLATAVALNTAEPLWQPIKCIPADLPTEA